MGFLRRIVTCGFAQAKSKNGSSQNVDANNARIPKSDALVPSEHDEPSHSSEKGSGQEPGGNFQEPIPPKQPNADTQEQERPIPTWQERVDKRLKELGRPPIPRIPDRSNELEEGDVMLDSCITRFVLRRKDGTVIKYGLPLNLQEVDAIRLAKDAGIPVPDVINSGKQPDGRHYNYISMKFIEGDTLSKVWNNMSDETRLDIAHQLRDLLNIMRKLPAPPNFIGGVNSHQLRDMRHMDVYNHPACHSVEEFNTFLTDEKGVPKSIQESFQRHIGTKHRVVLSHCDLAPRNIMVRDNRIVALIDWEMAGWYPEYWEYVKFMHNGSRVQGWKEFVDEIFSETYHDEFLYYTGLKWYQRDFDGNLPGDG